MGQSRRPQAGRDVHDGHAAVGSGCRPRRHARTARHRSRVPAWPRRGLRIRWNRGRPSGPQPPDRERAVRAAFRVPRPHLRHPARPFAPTIHHPPPHACHPACRRDPPPRIAAFAQPATPPPRRPPVPRGLAVGTLDAAIAHAQVRREATAFVDEFGVLDQPVGHGFGSLPDSGACMGQKWKWKGTGSIPPAHSGWQRTIRHKPSQLPRSPPKRAIAMRV